MELLKKYLSSAHSKTRVSSAVNPFLKKSIESMHMHIYPEHRDRISGSINFKNGTTEGTQKFSADSLDGLIRSMSDFVEELS